MALQKTVLDLIDSPRWNGEVSSAQDEITPEMKKRAKALATKLKKAAKKAVNPLTENDDPNEAIRELDELTQQCAVIYEAAVSARNDLIEEQLEAAAERPGSGPFKVVWTSF